MSLTDVTDLQNALLLQTLTQHGCFALVVHGGSMMPTLLQGDTVQLERLDGPPQLNDVVLVVDGGLFALHRVVGTRSVNNRKQYLIKGDAQLKADGWFEQDVLRARATQATTSRQVPFVIGDRPLSPRERCQCWRARRRRRGQ